MFNFEEFKAGRPAYNDNGQKRIYIGFDEELNEVVVKRFDVLNGNWKYDTFSLSYIESEWNFEEKDDTLEDVMNRFIKEAFDVQAKGGAFESGYTAGAIDLKDKIEEFLAKQKGC